MTLTATDVTVPIAAYARRFHANAGPRHHVGSPLGAWLLLALCAPASDGETRNILNALLGAESGAAADLAAVLLADPHPLVPLGAATWYQEPPGSDTALSRWLTGLPPEVDRGPLVSQAELDAWASRHTGGLIDRFPLDDPSMWFVVATAIATKVSWERPFDLAPASALGPSSPWAASLHQVLATPDGPGHQQFVAATEAAGDVAVHSAWARGGLQVTSVAAAPDVPEADVIAAAYDLAPALATGGPLQRRSLFDLPLGEGPLWAISERTGTVKGVSGRQERCSAALPAWSANSKINLSAPGLGFPEAIAALAPGGPWAAAQSAMARYGRVGFEAAAVSAAASTLAMTVPRRGLIRTAELRFGHPYAVVAVTVDPPGQSSRPAGVPGPWHGLPVFSAWVAEPEDAGQA
ncbi:MAG TPA: hypothetical protein VMF87_22740 [Streptosporangiaceae bacterium]|nr:hypothetical protein [Streptosporangiaceae bacterium]